MSFPKICCLLTDQSRNNVVMKLTSLKSTDYELVCL